MTERIDELIDQVFSQNGHRPEGEPEPDTRQRVSLDNDDLEHQTQQCWDVLEKRDVAYRYGSKLVRSVKVDGQLILQELTVDRLGNELARAGVFTKRRVRGTHLIEEPVMLPERIPRNMLAAASYPVSEIKRSTRVPVLMPNGTVLGTE